LLAGSAATSDLLDGVPLGWDRFGDAGTPVDRAMKDARSLLSRDEPEHALPALLAARTAFDTLPDGPRVQEARDSLERVIAATAGLFVRATSPTGAIVPGQTTELTTEVVLRRPAAIKLVRLGFPDGTSQDVDAALGLNEKKLVKRTLALPADAAISVPYWLAEPASAGHQNVSDARRIGAPRGDRSFQPRSRIARFTAGDAGA
jgi:hypothetical protein